MNCSKEPWVILFGGVGREGVITRLIQEGVPIASVLVPGDQSLRLRSSIGKLVQIGLPIEMVSRVTVSNKLAEYSEGNLLSVGFPYLIPKSSYARHKIALNIHPTLLPKYRGPTSGAYILINGELTSGSTVHYLDEGADKGDIIAQSEVGLSPFDTIRSLQRKVYATEPDLIMRAFAMIDEDAPRIAQDESRATIFPKRRKPEDSEIDPALPLKDLINYIRASDEQAFPAHFYHCGQKVCIKLWRPDKPDNEADLI